jgi:hypothetical protein
MPIHKILDRTALLLTNVKKSQKTNTKGNITTPLEEEKLE